MKVENRSSQSFEIKTVHNGNIKIRIENDGTVDVNGYLYRSDGNEGNNQMEYLEDVAKIFPQMVQDIKDKKFVQPKKKDVIKIIIREVSRILIFGGIGVVISQTLGHNLIIDFIAGLLVFVGAFTYQLIVRK